MKSLSLGLSNQTRYKVTEKRSWSFFLALFMHIILFAVLFIGLRWQNDPIVPIEVEMWTNIPTAAAHQSEVMQEPSNIEAILPNNEEQTIESIKEAPVKENTPKVVPDIIEKQEKRNKEETRRKAEPQKETKKTSSPPVAKPIQQKIPPKQSKEKVSKPLDIANIVGKAPKSDPRFSSSQNGVSGAKGGGKSSVLDAYLSQVKQIIKMNTIYSTNDGSNPSAVLKVFVLPDGTIRDVQIMSAVGDPAFAQARRQALLMMQKLPALPQGLKFSEMREWTIRTRLRE